MAVPWLGNVTPFTLTGPSQFLAAPPPALTSDQYVMDYNEVKALGALDSSSRTPEQTDLAQFWAANYVVLWNQALRDIAAAHVDNIAESARLFALADMAIADAVITAWNSKNQHNFWRPITAIREGNSDDPRTVADSSWMPLTTTPNYPDYTSGANNLTAAVTGILALFFGRDDMTFSVTTTNLGPTIEDTRTYSRFSDAAQDVVDARIYEGIHFRFADEAARKQGNQVASWAFKNFLRPLDNGRRWRGERGRSSGCRFAPGAHVRPDRTGACGPASRRPRRRAAPSPPLTRPGARAHARAPVRFGGRGGGSGPPTSPGTSGWPRCPQQHAAHRAGADRARRDAADVAISPTFGPTTLQSLRAWTDEVPPRAISTEPWQRQGAGGASGPLPDAASLIGKPTPAELMIRDRSFRHPR